MKKKIIGLLGMLLCLLSVGCGPEKKSEPVDVEQFRCQDSIQTVFAVLGETEIDDGSRGMRCYTYKNLNLWGYEGEVIFGVRDDKDTIRMFWCHLTLNDEELEDVYSQFSAKYGPYKEQKYTNGDTEIVWEFEEEEAEEAGYKGIRIQYTGDENYTVYFTDRYTIYEDEDYYERLKKLEESESDQTESEENEFGEYGSEEYEREPVADQTYSIGDDTFHFTISASGANYQLILVCNIEEKIDAFYTHIALNELMKSEDENIAALIEGFNFSYSILLGDGSMLTRTKSVLIVLDEDQKLMEVEEFFPVEELLGGENTDSDYGDQVLEFFVDFLETL